MQESASEDNGRFRFVYGLPHGSQDSQKICNLGWWTSEFEPNLIVLTTGTELCIPVILKNDHDQLSFSVLPQLPPGLSLDSTNGMIAGICRETQLAKDYRVTCKVGRGDAVTEKVRIRIHQPVPMEADIADLRCTVGNHISPVLILGRHWDIDLELRFSSTSLPTGLYLDDTTGEIYGCPEEEVALTPVEISWKSRFGDTGLATLSVQVSSAPSRLGYPDCYCISDSKESWIVKRLDAIIIPKDCTISIRPKPLSGSKPISYFTKPDLPKGLHICKSTGEISGKPDRLVVGTWKIFAGNDAGTVCATLTFTSQTGGIDSLHRIRPASPNLFRPPRPRLESISVAASRDNVQVIPKGVCRPIKNVGDLSRFIPKSISERGFPVITSDDFEKFLERNKRWPSFRTKNLQTGENDELQKQRKSERRDSNARSRSHSLTPEPKSLQDISASRMTRKHEFSYVQYHYKHEPKMAHFGQPGECMSVFTGHKDCVLAVCALERQGHFFTGSADESVNMWDLSGKMTGNFHGHSKSVRAICTSINEEMLYTASNDWTAYSWNIQSRRRLVLFKGHQAPITSIVQPYKHLLFTGSDDRTIIAWHQATGDVLRQMKASEFSLPVTCLTYHEKIIYGGYGLINRRSDSSAFVCGAFDIETGNLLHEFKGHPLAINGCAVAAPNLLLTCSSDMTARLFDIRSGRKEVRCFTGHASAVLSCATLVDKNMVFTGSEDKTAIGWDIGSGQQMIAFGGEGQYDGHRDSVVSIHACESRVYTGSLDGTARAWCLLGITEGG